MWTLEYSEDAERDFELIFDHLFDAYVELGDAPDEAVERTAERTRKLRVEIDRLVDTPYIGTAIWFLPVEHSSAIVVAAIFYGAQDHSRNMLARMLAR